MKILSFYSAIIFFIITSNSNIYAQSLNYSRVRVWLQGKDIRELGKCGVDISEGEYRKAASFTSDFSNLEIEKIKKAGFTIDILVPDVQKKYREQNKQLSEKDFKKMPTGCISKNPIYQTPNHFAFGSMGGYFTYVEMLAQLDSMRKLFPSLISEKQPISNTISSIEGRPIYYVKLSDHADTDESEPEVLYDAVHHAREPGSMTNLIYYMWYLLENYASNPKIKSIVDHTEMYFVPCVNPDGYIYNETTDPSGGGMWRKNRRDNGDGTIGVDINRNYGFQWGYDQNGSSSSGADEIYRGSSAFSEPETQSMRDFCIAHQFKIAMNYHTYGNLLVYPWGFLPDYYTADSSVYVNYGKILTENNHYLAGTANQTVNYVTNGDSDDWMYGDQSSKVKIFAMTPEIGISDEGFWPPLSSILKNCEDNLNANISASQLAGKFALYTDLSKDEMLSKNAYSKFSMTGFGLDTINNFVVSFLPLSANISFGSSKIYSNLNLMKTQMDSMSYNLSSTIAVGDRIRFLVNVDNGEYVYTDTISKVYGASSILLSEDGSTLNKWNVGAWGNTQSAFVSGPSSITDSPFGNYKSSVNEIFDLKSSISLPLLVYSKLVFYARWEIEKGFDFVQLLISDNQGASWTPLCGKYTVDGSIYQDFMNPVYDGSQLSWVKEEINLDAYAGKDILLMFTMNSDNFTEFDGFYFDDLEVISNGNFSSGILNQNLKLDQDFVEAYPNPSTNSIIHMKYKLSSTDKKNNFALYDISGRKLLDKPLIDEAGELNLTNLNLEAGVYFYGIEGKSARRIFKKLIIQ